MKIRSDALDAVLLIGFFVALTAITICLLALCENCGSSGDRQESTEVQVVD